MRQNEDKHAVVLTGGLVEPVDTHHGTRRLGHSKEHDYDECRQKLPRKENYAKRHVRQAFVFSNKVQLKRK